MSRGPQQNAFCQQHPLVVAVDDDPRVRESLKSLFDSAAIDAQMVSSAEEVLQICKSGSISCLITDVCMPGIDGWELQQLVAAMRPDLPIIFVTAHRDQQAPQRALALGAFGFFYKPFDGEELLRTVCAALECARNQWP
jgi:FixJ family two-component response regulator